MKNQDENTIALPLKGICYEPEFEFKQETPLIIKVKSYPC